MTKTQYLFTYGTLRDDEVQQAVFGRKLSGRRDILFGFKLSAKKLLGQYPVICKTENPDNTVVGQVFNVSNLDLHKADFYETEAYKRIVVQLHSGTEAWVYVENSE